MGWIRVLLSRCAALFRRRTLDRELDEELQSHLEFAIEENRRRGMKEEEARRAALRAFGGVTQVRETYRLQEGLPWVEHLTRDFGYALRQMRRSPGFAATVIGTLTLGIGAAAAMFTVVDHVLLRPAPYRDAGKLVAIRETGEKTPNGAPIPWLDIEQWIAQSRSFERIAFSTSMSGRNYLEGKAAAVQVDGEEVSPNLFETLGVRPALGQVFAPEPPSHAAGRNTGTIVLSYAVWKEAFGGDPGILGKAVRINEASFTVIGVMPPGFRYPASEGRGAQVWAAVQLGDHDKNRDYTAANYSVLARLRHGVSLRSAAAEMALIQKRVAAQYTDADDRRNHATATVLSYADSLVESDVKKALLALLAAAGVLWLIATVNVTNLLLARSTARQREIAMRGALGASRWRVMQQMMIEGLALSGAAALLGIGLAVASVQLLARELLQHLPLPAPATPDSWILAMLLGLTLVSALVSTAWPALAAVRAPIEPALKQGGMQTGTGRRHHRLRGALVALEIAMSLVLLVSCGLLLRTIYTLRHVPLGFRTDHILVANLNIPSYRFSNRNMTQALYMPMLERVQHLHGVDSAGLTSVVPLGRTFTITLTLRDDHYNIDSYFKAVTPDIQRVFGFRMAAGRYFNAEDTPTSQPVVVVNQAFARLHTPDKNNPAAVLGTKLLNIRKDTPSHIVGILDDERQRTVSDPSQPEVEIAIPQITPDSGFYQATEGIAMDLAVRTERPINEMIPELREILRQVSPELQGATITTMDQIVEDSYGSQRLAAHLLEIFGGSALLLCVAGLYGLLAYVVTQRTREMGVRIALGAQRGNLLWLVMRQAGAMLLAGVAAGTILALASQRLVRGFLYGVNAHDGWTLAAAAVLLLASGLAAAYLPARRAASIDPMRALRTE